MNSLRCEWCGQHASDEYPVWGHKENIDSPYMVSHQTQGYCIMAALARAEVLEVAFANSHNLNESLGDENRALLARAEAAEAERNELRERHDNLKNAYANLVEEAAERLVRRLVRMYAAERRVAELEAQLASAESRAAQALDRARKAEVGQWMRDLAAPPEAADLEHLSDDELAEMLGLPSALRARPALLTAARWRALAYEARDERRDAIDRAEAAETEVARLCEENRQANHAFDRQQERGNRLAAELKEAERWNRVTDTEPPDGVRVLMQVEAWRRGRIWQYLDDAMLVRGWKPLPPVLRSWPHPTEEGGDGS
jgi:hypothetical protein